MGSRGGNSSCSASPTTGVPRTEFLSWLPGREGVRDLPAETGGTIEPAVGQGASTQGGPGKERSAEIPMVAAM